MSAYEDKDTKLVLQVLRIVRGWDQAQFAAAAGLSQGTISRYESGERVKPHALAKLAAVAGQGLPWVETYLLPILRAARARAAMAEAHRPSGGRQPLGFDLPPSQRDLADAIGNLVDISFAKLETDILAAETAPQGIHPPPAAADREEAAHAWERLLPCTAAERRFLVEECAEYQGWALAELLCHESEPASATDLASAVELAHLAVAVAQLAPGDELWRKRLLGYARAHLAHALHLAGDLAAAGSEHATAWALWREGAEGDTTGLLEEGRLLRPSCELPLPKWNT
jgi:transcriptional regulator with XRE-family HTH domain